MTKTDEPLDVTRGCSDCGRSFTLRAATVGRFKAKGRPLPLRCWACHMGLRTMDLGLSHRPGAGCDPGAA